MRYYTHLHRLFFAAVLITAMWRTFAISAQPADSPRPPNSAAEVEQAIRNVYDAISRGDGTQIDTFIARDGFAYAKTFKSSWTYILTLVKSGSKYSYEFSDFKFAENGVSFYALCLCALW